MTHTNMYMNIGNTSHTTRLLASTTLLQVQLLVLLPSSNSFPSSSRHNPLVLLPQLFYAQPLLPSLPPSLPPFPP